MIMYHGTRLYAVYSRDVGTFGGRAKRATIKVYDGSDCGKPRATISGNLVVDVKEALTAEKSLGRAHVNHYLRRLLPSNDPYRLEA